MDRELVRAVDDFFRRHEVQAFLMGGTVRDILLGKVEQAADMDWLVSQSHEPMALARELARELDGHFVPLHAEHGTARVVFDKEDGRRSIVDLVELRAPTLLEDLVLHDFTINAMALEPQNLISGAVFDHPDLVIDPTQGRSDLEAGLVRVISERSFLDDPVRMLRGIRFVAKLRFELESETAALIRTHAQRILRSSPERVRDELLKTLANPDSARYLGILADLGLLFYIFPEVEEAAEPLARVTAVDRVIEASAPEIQRFLRQPLVAGAGSERSRRVILLLAGLLAHAGAEGAMGALERLRLSRNEIKTAGVSLRLLPVLDALYEIGGGSRANRGSFYRAAGDESIPAVVLWLSLRGGNGDRLIFLDAALHERASILDLAPLLTGTDIQQYFELQPGPQIKTILDTLRDAQLEGQVHTRDEALNYVAALLAQPGDKNGEQ